MSAKTIDSGIIQHLYSVEGLSAWEIAERQGVRTQRIREEISKHGWDKQPRLRPAEGGLRFYNSRKGYERINHSYRNEERQTVYVHQLVAIANGESPEKVFSGGAYHVHHDNGVKWDNRPENLEVLSRSEHQRLHCERGDVEPPAVERKYSDEELLEWIDTFVEEFGVVPSGKDVKGWPGPNHETYRKWFGTWSNALRAAGYTPRGEDDE